MKNRKGFTLIELIGVILILSLLLLVTVPAIIELLDSSKNKKLEELSQTLELATETYVEQNRDLFPELENIGSKAFIRVGNLIDAKLVKDDIKGVNDEDIDNFTIIASIGNDNIITYKYTNNDSNVSGYIRDNLVLHYDGYNQPKDNIWEDLSGNGNNGTLANFSLPLSYDNGINFDGVDDVINAAFTFPKEAFTIEFIFESQEYRYTELKYGPISFKWRIADNIPYVNFWDTTSPNTTSFDKMLPINIPMTITITFDGSKRNLYVNSKLAKSVTGALTLTTDNTIVLGNGTEELIGKIYGLRIYNKVLTSSDMSKNYEVDKNRFDI